MIFIQGKKGCVQEEIRFLISPECIVSRLFTEELGSKESMIIIGSQKFAKYEGYSETYKFAGNYEDKTQRLILFINFK